MTVLVLVIAISLALVASKVTRADGRVNVMGGGVASGSRKAPQSWRNGLSVTDGASCSTLEACQAAVRRLNHLSTRRLWLIGRREHRIVALLRMIHKLRGGRGGSTPLASRPAHYSAWLCIHSHEGSWTDSGDPYWGGLQMDRNFMQTYAPRSLLRRGWANVWTPLEQMWVAERAYRSGRGFSPWPNTARMCGLL